MTSAKPAIVVAHGAWHSPLTYSKLTSTLQQAGYEVHVPYFPSCTGARPPAAGLPEDTLLLRRLVEMLADTGRKVIMVMHSYGGIVGDNAIQGLDLASRAAAGKKGGVAHLVGVAAHLHPAGFGAYDLVREFGNEDLLPLAIETAEDGSCMSADARLLLFKDLPDDEAEALVCTLSRAPVAIMEAKTEFEAWKHIPLTYVTTSQDFTLPPHYQQRILEKIERAGVKAEVVTFDTGHSPHATMPAELAKIIGDVASKVS